MSEEQAFVEQVRLHPHDDTPRLIYADYLEEAGDAQGELIRVQVELAATPVGNPRRLRLAAREGQLLTEHGEVWLERVRKLGAEGANVRCFQRGLIERVKIDAGTFLQTGAELCSIAPALYCLELRDVADRMEQLAEYPLPRQITALDLASKRLQAAHLNSLSSASWLEQITQLNLQGNRFGDDGAAALAELELPKLKVLTLDFNRLGPDAATALAFWPTLAVVKRLSLSVNQLGELGVQRLMASVFLTSMERLDLAANGIGHRGVRHIADAKSLNSISELNLRSNQIVEGGLPRLIDSPWVQRLTGLDLRGNQLEAINRTYSSTDGLYLPLPYSATSCCLR